MEQGQAGKLETAILAGGCFWSLEAVFDRLQGVDRAESDYMGGDVGDPSYEQDCNRDTGYAEIVRITFDPNIVSDRELPEVFFSIHDRTALDRQGHDVGSRYRSAIFYLAPQQQSQAEPTTEKAFSPIVTELVQADIF